jgi:hypothetical protein
MGPSRRQRRFPVAAASFSRCTGSARRQAGFSLLLLAVLLLLLVATASLMHAAWSLEMGQKARRAEQSMLAQLVAESALSYGLEYLRAAGIGRVPGQAWLRCPALDADPPCSLAHAFEATRELQVLAGLGEHGREDPWLLGWADGRVAEPAWPLSGPAALPWRVAIMRCPRAEPDDPLCLHAAADPGAASALLLAEVLAPDGRAPLARAGLAVRDFPLVADGPQLPLVWVDGEIDLHGRLSLAGEFAENDLIIAAATVRTSPPGQRSFMVCGSDEARAVATCEACLCPHPDALAAAMAAREAQHGHAADLLLGLARGGGAIRAFAREYARPVEDCRSLTGASSGLLAAAGPCFVEAESLGSAEAPVVLLVEGDLALSGGTVVHGVIVFHGRARPRLLAPAGARVEGALLADAGLLIEGALEVVRPPDLRARLRAAPALRGWGPVLASRRILESWP